MYVTNFKTNEKGFALVNTLMFIVFLGLIAVTITKLVVADMQQQAYYLNEKRAFYAAQSGIEYLISGIEKSAPSYSSVSVFNNYTENIPTGNGTRCTVIIHTIGADSLRLEAIGESGEFKKTIYKGYRYADVSLYAVYASGRVRYVNTIPSGRIKQYAAKMPLFDLDVLRNMAKPTRYFPNNLTVNGVLTYSGNHVVFVEHNLTFNKFNWLNVGHFVAGNIITLKSSWLPFGSIWGTFYMPNPNSLFKSKAMLFPRFQFGGLVVNGNVIGTSIPWWYYRYTVIYNRNYLNQLLQYSINKGPVVFWNSSWDQH